MVNKTLFTYNVTAGIGAFRGSYVASFLDELRTVNGISDNDNESILPYSIITTASNLVINAMHSVTSTPISCEGQNRRCNSYLLPGGLRMATPWPPTDNEDYPTITISNAPATQIDFLRNMEQEQMFDDTQDCLVFGSEKYRVGIQFCLSESRTRPDALLAGKMIVADRITHTNIARTIRLPKRHSGGRVPYKRKSSQANNNVISLPTSSYGNISPI